MKRIVLSNHAIDRYIERVKPQLTREGARAELESLVILAGAIETEPPSFAPHDVSYGKRTASHFLSVSEGISLALVPATRAAEPMFLAVTCLTRFGLSENGRARRNERAARRRARRRRRHRMEKGRSNRRDAA